MEVFSLTILFQPTDCRGSCQMITISSYPSCAKSWTPSVYILSLSYPCSIPFPDPHGVWTHHCVCVDDMDGFLLLYFFNGCLYSLLFCVNYYVIVFDYLNINFILFLCWIIFFFKYKKSIYYSFQLIFFHFGDHTNSLSSEKLVFNWCKI